MHVVLFLFLFYAAHVHLFALVNLMLYGHLFENKLINICLITINNTSECVYGHEYKQLPPLMMFVKSSNGVRPSLFCIYSIVISVNTKLTNKFVLSNLSMRELIKSSIDARKSEILPPSKKYTLTKFVLENTDIQVGRSTGSQIYIFSVFLILGDHKFFSKTDN